MSDNGSYSFSLCVLLLQLLLLLLMVVAVVVFLLGLLEMILATTGTLTVAVMLASCFRRLL